MFVNAKVNTDISGHDVRERADLTLRSEKLYPIVFAEELRRCDTSTITSVLNYQEQHILSSLNHTFVMGLLFTGKPAWSLGS